MGKQKRRRGRPHKKNPTGLVSVKDFDEFEDTTEGPEESALQNVYDDLQSCDMEEKLSALQTLETMAWDPTIAKHIAKDAVAKTVGPLLLDNNVEIRAAAAAALRQIADSGGEKAHTDLMNDDIMTPLTALLQKHYSDCSFKSDRKTAMEEKETYIQAVNLLLILCENNESAINFVNNQKLVSVLTRYLDINTYDMKIITVTLQCLATVTEDNTVAVEEVRSSEESFRSILAKTTTEDAKPDPEALLVRVTLMALLCNMYDRSSMCKSSYFNIIIQILDEVFSIDNKQLLSGLVSILPHEKNAASSGRKKQVEDSKMLLNTQQSALETFANVLLNDDSDIKLATDQVDDDSNKMDVDEIDVDSTQPEIENTIYKYNLRLPPELVEACNYYKLFDKIWEKTIAVDADSQEILEQTAEGKNVLKQFYILRCRTYICLHNFLCQYVDLIGSVESLYSKFLETWKAVNEEMSEDNPELKEAASNALRAIVEHCNLKKMSMPLTEDNVNMILNNKKETQCSENNIGVNMIRVLGELARNMMLNLKPHTYPTVKRITEMLLNICTMATSAWVIAEALDAIMDLYSEDDTKYVAAELKLVEKLNSIVLIFKTKVQQQKRQLKDKMAVVSTVKSNIFRFIKYKEKEIESVCFR